MRILVISDSHGNYYNILKAVEQQPSAEMIVFLGDGESDFAKCHVEKPCIQVKGNCDWGSDLPACVITEEKGRIIYCTHGYAEMVKFGDENLIMRAKENHAHIALYGHTHNPVTDYKQGIYLVNPGSIHDGKYAVVDITPNGIMPILMDLR